MNENVRDWVALIALLVFVTAALLVAAQTELRL